MLPAMQTQETRSTNKHVQEENQFLANPIEAVKKMPEHIQRMIGYSVSSPYCGWVDLKDPITFVRDVKVGYKDL